MQLEVSDLAYNFIWMCMFLLHAGCIGYFMTCAHLLWFVDTPLMVYIVYYIMPPVQAVHFPVFGAVAAFVGALHAVALMRLVVLSAFVGRLALSAPPEGLNQGWRRIPEAACARAIAYLRSVSYYTTTVRSTEPQQKQLANTISRHLQAIFGVHSSYFNEVLIGREVIEIAAQGYQAYRCSNIIASTNVIDTYMGTLFLNCWSTPLVYSFFFTRTSHNVLLERVICITIDGLLNLVTSTVIPVVLFMPYYYAYDPELYGFTQDRFYDTTWFASFVTECQLIFPVTVIDFLSKLTPHMSILICMLTIVPLITRRPTVETSVIVPASTSEKSQINEVSEEPSRHPRAHSAPSKPRVALSLLIMITGCTLMALHIHAKLYVSNREVVGCRHKTYPWLPSNFPCMVFEYNCYQHGTSTVRSMDLEGLEPNSLLWLTFSHCGALVIPPTIQQFPALVGFMILNASVIEWEADAGFVATTHTNLGALYFVAVNFTSFPGGLLQQLPPMLSDIEFSHTNLTFLPNTLHEHWPDLALLYFEFCHFAEFPETLTKISIDYLSLLGNNISNASLLSQVQSPMVSMDFNPVQRLPEQLQTTQRFSWLALENMQLESIPDWLQTDVDVAYLYGNPYCDTVAVDEDSVKCFTRDIFADGMLPYEYLRQITPC